MIDQSETFEQIRAILRECVGTSRAITLDGIAAAVGLEDNRRAAERVIQLRLPDFGFTIVSDTRCGLFRPQTPDELNHYRNQLRSRIKELQTRLDTVDIMARGEGWQMENGSYTRAPMQGQLSLGLN